MAIAIKNGVAARNLNFKNHIKIREHRILTVHWVDIITLVLREVVGRGGKYTSNYRQVDTVPYSSINSITIIIITGTYQVMVLTVYLSRRYEIPVKSLTQRYRKMYIILIIH